MFSKIWLLSNDPWSLMRWSLRSSSKRGNDGYYISVAIFIGIKCIGKIFYCMPPIFILTSNYPEKYWERHKIFTMCNIEAYHHNKLDIDILLYNTTNICNQLYAFPLFAWGISWYFIAILPWYSLVIVCLHYQCWPMKQGKDYITGMNNQ